MNIGVLTSGFFHILFGFLLFINLENILIQRKDVIQNVKVELISETDYKKLILEEKIKKSKPLETGEANFVKPIIEKKRSENAKENKIKAVGNELKGVTEPEITKVEIRKTPGEIITGIAQLGEEGTNYSENVREIPGENTSPDKTKPEKKNKKNAPTTTNISPEGKNTAIVSGALKIAKIPSKKPNDFRELKLTESTEEADNSDIYDQLINEVTKENSVEEKEVNESPMQNFAKARMLEKLNSNWNVVSINRLPNFEKYVIILEIPLNSRGNIIGAIKTVYPKSLEGNFLIAKRSAINAVLESIPFQVPEEIFPNGLILRVVFDPKTNVGANNG